MRSKQSGFGVVEIIIAVLVVAALAYGGYRLYGHFSKPAANTTNRQSNQENITTATTTPQSTYLDIKELGIKIKLDDSIKDAIYVAGTSTDGSQFAYISTQTLTDKSNGSCNPAKGSFASITKTPDAVRSVDNARVFKLGNNYIFITGPQAICSDDQTVQDLANQQKTTLFNDFKTVQLDN